VGSALRDGGRASIHSLRWYISVGLLLVGVVPLIFFGAQRIASLFATQNASIQQKHEPMAVSLSQAIYGYLMDQTSALQSTASQLESDNAGLARLNQPGFDPTQLNQELAAAHSAQPALLQLYVGNLAGRAGHRRRRRLQRLELRQTGAEPAQPRAEVFGCGSLPG
jgi:hypothetical protein